jgi:leucyl aminopeptidase
MSDAETGETTAAKTITFVPENGLEHFDLPGTHRAWAEANGFAGKLGDLLALPGVDGTRTGYLFGIGRENERPVLAAGLAAAAVKVGRYVLAGDYGEPTRAALAFALGAYGFERYRSAGGRPVLDAPEGADLAEVARLRDAAFLARDLINTPANDLGPEAFEREIRAFAEARGAEIRMTTGDDLLTQNLPMIHAVGRASHEAPRLADLSWGRADAPKITLVGKGVTFDSGGLDIKPAAGMALMKKDMGGAANVLGLAHALIDARLDIRLRVLLPIVENAISGRAFRPGDVLKSRAGLTVEIGNTDAEGRLILADALALADEEHPALLFDMATLTGAARVALGPDLPPLYSTDAALCAELVEAGTSWGDPLWPMPLWGPYGSGLKSKIADINHVAGNSFAGSVVAALFLKRFVKNAGSFVHLDIFAWAPEPRPGRPFGGTDQGIRAVYQVLKDRYG